MKNYSVNWLRITYFTVMSKIVGQIKDYKKVLVMVLIK